MKDVIPTKQSSLKTKVVAVMMFLKLNISLIPNNPTEFAESLIWNTLIPSRPEFHMTLTILMIMKMKMKMMMMMKKKKKIYHRC